MMHTRWRVARWSGVLLLGGIAGLWSGGCPKVGPSNPGHRDGAMGDASDDAGEWDAGDAGPVCGDGVRETGEACDGSDVGGTGCVDYGFGSGGLDCSNRHCTVDLGDCSFLPSCGDGTLDASETCDDGNGKPWDGCTACRITEYSIVRDDGTDPAWYPSRPLLAVAPDGAFLTLNHHRWCGGDACWWTHYVQRFGRQGQPLGDLTDFEVDFSDTGAIAAASDGSYLVVWYEYSGTFARRFLPNGMPVSGPVPLGMEVGLEYVGDLFSVDVTAGAPGTWIVVWERRLHLQGITDFVVVAQLLGFDGAPLGEPIQVCEENHYCQHPAVSADATGNFVVAWDAHNAIHETDIYVRRFGADGTPLGPEAPAQVEEWPGYQVRPDVAMAPSGRFLVVWNYGATGRFFEADGTPDASEVHVSDWDGGSQLNVTVAATPDGRFVVAWESEPDQDGFGAGVFMRWLDASGQLLGTDRQVNVLALGNQRDASVGTAADGSVVMAWTSVGADFGSAFPLMDGAIFVQRYDPVGAPLGLGPTIGPGP